MASSPSVPIVSPQPRRTVPLIGQLSRNNRFLPASVAPGSDEGAFIAKEIDGILQSRANCRPAMVIGNKTSPTLARRLHPVEKQPPRSSNNPILSDVVFQELEKSGIRYPWESPLASPQL